MMLTLGKVTAGYGAAMVFNANPAVQRAYLGG